jgi:ribonuclease Z
VRTIPDDPLAIYLTSVSVKHLPARCTLWDADRRWELGTGQFAFAGIDRDFDLVVRSTDAEARISRLYAPTGTSPRDSELVVAGEAAWRDFVKLRAIARAKVARVAEERQHSAAQAIDDVTVTTLGTGSASPAQYRNGKSLDLCYLVLHLTAWTVSATLLDVPEHGVLMLDCGENTLGQLQRLAGPVAAKETLRRLRLICISHMHSDHHSGLARLLRARAQTSNPPTLSLVAPKLVWLALQDHDALESLSLSTVRYTPAHTLLKSGAASADVLDGLGLDALRFVEVDHRGGQCFGCVIDHHDGWRVVCVRESVLIGSLSRHRYSGDTRPCDRLVEAGQGADLLIHEATLDDEYVDSARVKGHSTTGQALDIAKRCGPRVLTTYGR